MQSNRTDVYCKQPEIQLELNWTNKWEEIRAYKQRHGIYRSVRLFHRFYLWSWSFVLPLFSLLLLLLLLRLLRLLLFFFVASLNMILWLNSYLVRHLVALMVLNWSTKRAESLKSESNVTRLTTVITLSPMVISLLTGLGLFSNIRWWSLKKTNSLPVSAIHARFYCYYSLRRGRIFKIRWRPTFYFDLWQILANFLQILQDSLDLLEI